MKNIKQSLIGKVVGILSDENISAKRPDKIIELLSREMSKLFSEKQRVHGFRIENMFSYVAGALGGCKLIKLEDCGSFFAYDSNIRIPDYRIITNEGEIFLVEIKNCNNKRIEFKEKYIDELKKYASLNKIPLKIAVYWRLFKIWTLIPIDVFVFQNGKCVITIDKAIAISEMSILNDRMIATKAPLKLRLIADLQKTSDLDTAGECQFTIKNIELYSNETLISDTFESSIAFQFAIYLSQSGKWKETEKPIIKDKKVIAIEYQYEPNGESINQNFEIIGNLSSIISSKYDSSTTSNGEVTKISLDCDPMVFEIFIPNDYTGKFLPLWRFILQPNHEYSKIESKAS
jgi:Holliday junction resolvase